MALLLEEMLSDALGEIELQERELRKTSSLNCQDPADRLADAIERNKSKVQVLQAQIAKRDEDAVKHADYLQTPQHKADMQKITKLEAELYDLNKQYCNEGQALLNKIQSMHALDDELCKLKGKAGVPVIKKMSTRDFIQVTSIERGINQAIADGKLIERARAISNKMLGRK